MIAALVATWIVLVAVIYHARKTTMDLSNLKSAVANLQTAASAATSKLASEPTAADQAALDTLAAEVQAVATQLSAAVSPPAPAPAPAPVATPAS